MNETERDELIDQLLDSSMTEADFIRLEAEFLVDPAARRAYYERIVLTTLLESESASEGVTRSTALSSTMNSTLRGAEFGAAASPGAGNVNRASQNLGKLEVSRFWRTATMAMATAVALAAIYPASSFFFGRREPTNGLSDNRLAAEQSASGYAVVAGQSAAVWHGAKPIANGGLVPSGRLQLETGIVHLELFSGVTLVVQGHADFEIVSPMEVRVTRGKLRAHVPEPAHGFRIRTNEGDVVDLGTEFAVNVSEEQSELHVLDGAVEWQSKSKSVQRMEQGHAARWTEDGDLKAIAANAVEFVGADELRAQLTSNRRARLEVWERFQHELRSDERIVARYEMRANGRGNRQLANWARTTAEQATSEGTVVAAASSTDRWGRAEGGLDFSPTGSRVRVSLPGEFGSLTFLCWVKINSLDRLYNSLFLTDGHDLHEPHWQILNDGRLFFSVKKRDTWDAAKGEKDKHIYYSPSFWDASQSGQWIMLATVYDVDRRQVLHYFNGELLSRENIPAEYLVEHVAIGNASLGNWGLPERDEPQFAVRNLNGSMDEFTLFSAALAGDEISKLYKLGSP